MRSRGDVRARASDKYVFDPDNSSILVAGGGGVGILVTRMLKDMGSWVWMLQRTDNRRAEIESMMAIVINGDATNKDDVARVFDEIDSGSSWLLLRYIIVSCSVSDAATPLVTGR